MLIISRTPVRISFFGGGTDYPSYFLEHQGAVLGTTIDQYTYISVKTFESSFFDHNIRIAYSRTELVKALDQIQHPSIRETLRFREKEGNLDIHIFSDLPARTGLGSSSSFTVGFLNALYAIEGEQISKQQLAEEACHIEQNLIKENVGSQDQFHTAFGGFNLIEFKPSGNEVRPLILTNTKKQMLQDHLLVFFTGITRFANEVVKEQLENTKKRLNDHHLQQMYDLVFKAEQILVHEPTGSMAQGFGELVHENWLLKKQLSNKVTNPQIDMAYDAAYRAGAYGGKLCGAGNGGFLALFVPPEKHASVRNALKELQEVSFKFEDSGSSIVYMKD
ncbi:MAG: D-glycero-alpha-D-manno-heptose 7-phosphate kinase [Chlamydiales bacterium]|nr:D-glycero-alpha-D-manno-heptose 7-phosphate kinase [Chlamydiales bacterium]MCH9619508.1 D-glycero-alpha-D-manno-heptose 7-phosphate kinase [Chlamydiales bacterium]MCH9622312.1 D-glycero-alpha-D-manno-heptose 7-phosphate kinase [Chlamydiales bacterium]